MILRDYQTLGIEHAVRSLRASENRCYAAPTGSGKSVVELAIQRELPNCWIVTPTLEIVAGLLQKQGVDTAPLSEDAIITEAFARQISTPIRLRNRLLAGEPIRVDYMLIDEGHHDNAETYQQLHALTCCPAALFTASPYRGTPKGTAAFRERWGEPVWLITYPEAVERGYITMPTVKIVPLVDDDLLTVQDGEFVVRQVAAATRDKFEDITRLARDYTLDRPTMFAVPNRDIAATLTRTLNAGGYPAVEVTGDTPHAERQQAFADCIACRAALVQIRVVSEGVDLPIARLIDLAPTISPVEWIQRFGRITRPGLASEYICTNRNFLRHHYLLEGCYPPIVTKEAVDAFGGLGKRLAVRVLGIESLGRLKPVSLPLVDGGQAVCYSVAGLEGARCVEYFVIIHPAKEEPFWARRENVKLESGQKSYGQWMRCAPPADLAGFASLAPVQLSDKQRDWWKRSAKRWGLDPDAEITRKEFPALPVLTQTRYRL